MTRARPAGTVERMVTVELRKPDPRGRQRLLHPRTGAERRRLITLAHESRCKLGLSYRGTRDRLAEHGA